MKRARVAYLDHHGDIVGGGQISLLALMQGLQEYEAVCWCGARGSMSDAVNQAGVEGVVCSMPALRVAHVASIFRAVIGLLRQARQGSVVLLHANSSRSMCYAALVGWLTGLPVVWHVRIAQAERRIDRVLARWAHGIIAISSAVERRFPADLRHKVHLVHNGVDVDAYALAAPGAWKGAWGAGPTVGMVAQLIPWKRQDDFIRAMALVAKTYPDARYVLVGEEPEGPSEYGVELRNRVREVGLERSIHFVGFCREMPALYADLDVVVLCSENEPFGRVLIEAMAAAKPVVATRGGGVGDIVVEGETGYLVEMGDCTGIATAVVDLLADPVRAQAMGEAGQRRARQKFSIAAHVERVEALYGALRERPSA